MRRFAPWNRSDRKFVEYLSIRTSCLSQTCFILKEAQMEPETRAPARAERANGRGTDDMPAATDPDPKEIRDLDWVLTGRHGLRAAWSIAIFLVMYRLFAVILGTMVVGFYPP